MQSRTDDVVLCSDVLSATASVSSAKMATVVTEVQAHERPLERWKQPALDKREDGGQGGLCSP